MFIKEICVRFIHTTNMSEKTREEFVSIQKHVFVIFFLYLNFGLEDDVSITIVGEFEYATEALHR